MFDQYIICENSLRAASEQGRTIGYRLDVRLPYYRGLGLSMVEDVAIVTDGAAVPRENIRLELRGQSWTLDALEQELDQRWNFGEVASLLVLHDGGLAPGTHEVEVSERLRISYLPFTPTTRGAKSLTMAR
jgi:hypothetical protein